MGTYSTIVDSIQLAAEAVNPTGRFSHGRKVDVSQEYNGAGSDSASPTGYPLINLYPFKINRDNDDNDSSKIIIGFFMQDRPDTSMDERQSIIDQMDDLSDAFLAELGSSILQVNDLSKEPQYQYYSGTISGFAISFTALTKSPCDATD